MTRRDIIMQILSEAAGRPLEETGCLFEAMLEEDLISSSGLEMEIPAEEAEKLLEDFRQELPGIRRWLIEVGLLPDSGHA